MLKLLSRFCQTAWLGIVYLMGAVMFIALLAHWQSWTIPQILSCLLCVAIPAHVFEENTFPGGFFFMNNLSFGSKAPKIYPQNRLTNMITNLGAETVFILLFLNVAAIEASAIVVVVFFGIVETVNHTREGIAMLRRYKKRGKRTIYAPGLATSIFPLLPMAIWGIIWLAGNPVALTEVVMGIGISLAVAVVFILIPFAFSIKIKSKEFAFQGIGYFEKFEQQ